MAETSKRWHWIRMERRTTSRRILALCVAGVLSIGAAVTVRVMVPRLRQSAAERQRAAGLAALQETVRRSPGDLNARWALARALAAEQQMDGFIEQLEEVAKLAPESGEVWGALGEAYVTQGDGSAAERAYRELLKRDPKAEAPYHGLTLALGLQKRYREAVEVAERGLRAAPKSETLRIDLALSALRYASDARNPAVKDTFFRKAIDQLEELGQASTESGLVYYYLGQGYLGIKENDEALRTLERAAKLMPDDPRPLGALARAYQSRGDRAKATEKARAVAALVPGDAEAQAYLGELISASQVPEERAEALRAIEKACSLRPEEPRYQELLGAALVRAGRLEEAAQVYQKALTLDPHRSGPYQQLAAVYTRLGKPDAATSAADAATKVVFNEQQLKYLEQRVAVESRNTGLRLQLADRYREINQPALALDEYLQVLRLDAGSVKARKAVEELKKELGAAGARP